MPVDIAMTYICCYDTFRFNNITCRFDFFNCRLQIIIAVKTLYHNPSRTNTLFTDQVAMWNKKKRGYPHRFNQDNIKLSKALKSSLVTVYGTQTPKARSKYSIKGKQEKTEEEKKPIKLCDRISRQIDTNWLQCTLYIISIVITNILM